MKTLTQRAYTEAVIEETVSKVLKYLLKGAVAEAWVNDLKAQLLEKHCREATVVLTVEQMQLIFASVAGGLATQAPFETVLDALSKSVPAFAACRDYCQALQDHAAKTINPT